MRKGCRTKAAPQAATSPDPGLARHLQCFSSAFNWASAFSQLVQLGLRPSEAAECIAAITAHLLGSRPWRS